LKVLAFLFAGALVVGAFWLGGHSGGLPAPLRDFARDDDLATVDAALERVHDQFYTDVGRDELANEAIRGIVAGLDDRFSSYFDPRSTAGSSR
jgi:hypothetical protein